MAATAINGPAVLGDDEVAAFQRDGYLVPRFRFEGDQLRRLQIQAEKLLADNPGRGDEPMVCPHVPGAGVQGLKGDGAWLEFSIDQRVLDMVEQLIGPDIILWGTNCFHKPAGTGRRIPFHRDGRYWPIEPLATVTVWVAIESTDRGNGCLRIIPGSHQGREVGEHFTSRDPADAIPETLSPNSFDESSAVDVALEAGQMALFDVYTVHGSWANTGDRRRLGYAMRYMPSTSCFNHDGAQRRDMPSNAHHTRPLFLVRGVDRCGRNDFQRGHPPAT
jgi:hypothetical protein